MNDNVEIIVDPGPSEPHFSALWLAAWGEEWTGDLARVLERSLAHLGAYDGDALVGYINIAWDGGAHAFLLDPMVHPDYRHRGIGSTLVRHATDLARQRGARWLHVDYEPHLDGFYKSCGFRPTTAGLMAL